MNKELAIECIKTQRQFVDDMTREAFDMAIALIKEAKPTADVEPVRHGRWFQDAIYYGEDGSPCIVDICTECGAYGDYADFNYCPNCGAKMDEEDTEQWTE